ncbi:unnamed protein product [Spirodela intermedia]|uniref:Uncharacterized protein n=1 Tax=Spirodela intermedia TaxID=51605 RepID=A0A7I8IA66_SPIIN|nr:unnamed protein product [Spirodela intermedia]CAA6653801.1 unnamed protein product [Spirodela intermedia]
MGEVLAELERVLRSDPKETITLDEELVLQKCKTRAVNTFLTSAGISSALVWGGRCCAFMGGWTFDKSLNSSVQSILAAHGTRMQRERHVQEFTKPWVPISKIFYPEHVYDDSSREKPLRNTSVDTTVSGLGDLIADPLDYILGYPEDEALQSDAPVISRRQTQAQKRRQRRHPIRHDRNSPFMASPKTKTLSL